VSTRTWMMDRHFPDGGENTGRKNAGQNCRTWKCKTWKCKTCNQLLTEGFTTKCVRVVQIFTSLKPNSITLASSELTPNMFEAGSCQIPLH